MVQKPHGPKAPWFQDREMIVKWHGCKSVPWKVKGGGPQGATLGLLEYISQSNDNSDCVSERDLFIQLKASNS